MARRTKDELLAEFHRSCDIFELTWEFVLERMDPAEAERVRDRVPSRERLLSHLGRNGITLSQLTTGVRQAINDHSEQLGHWVEGGSPDGPAFLAFYRERTGRDWYADAGHPARMAREILKRGRIANETEWYLLTAIVADTEQAVFDPPEAARIEALLRAFGDAVPLRASSAAR